MFGAETKSLFASFVFPIPQNQVQKWISAVTFVEVKGCPFCKHHTGWVEILGCGMVDPNVLGKPTALIAKIYSGYALGMGIERITNLKYQVKDFAYVFRKRYALPKRI